MKILHALAGFGVGLAAFAGSAAAGSAEPEHARAKMIVEHAEAVPGQVLAVGVTFDIDPGWHLYWDGCNDSGFPIDIRLSVPEGWVAGGVQWPAPDRRYRAPGGLVLDHIYEKRVTLILPVQVPADAEPGSRATIGADVEWLVCDDACIPGFATLSIEVPVASAGGESVRTREAALFDEARAQFPKPLPPEAKSPVRISMKGSTLVVKGDAATTLTFFPRRECNAIVDRFKGPVGEKGVLQLELTSETAKVDGVLEIRNAKNERIGLYTLTWPTRPMTPPTEANEQQK